MEKMQFEIGDRVTYASPVLPYQKGRGTGEVIWESLSHYYIRWSDFLPKIECPHLKDCDPSSQLIKVPDSGKPNKLDTFPELSSSSKTQGYFEYYSVINKQGREYYYQRYVYVKSSGKLKHHHVSNKQADAIKALWRSGAAPKEICAAIGK